MNLTSILIPTYNRVHLIIETLDSIKEQTNTNWECIIVDDGSDDGSKDVIGEYIQNDTRFQYYQRPPSRKKGANTCRNMAFEKSKGQYIKWFDSDDIMLPNALEKQVEFLEKEKVDVVLSEFNYFVDGIKGAKSPVISFSDTDLFLGC